MLNGIKKRHIQVALGLLWIIDGLLQLQPAMFTHRFADQVLAPAAVGQPSLISGPMYFAIHIILMHPAIYTVLFATIQLSIGALLLNKRTVRYGLISSIVWGLIVWFMGEGMGGVLGGSVLLLTGAPGAALLYSLLSFAVLPGQKNQDGHLPSWLNYAWIAVWLSGIVLLLYSQAGPNSLSSAVLSANSLAPGWMFSVAHFFSTNILDAGPWAIITPVILYGGTGLLVLFGVRARKAGVILGILLALYIWLVGESFGGVYSGLATDLNSGPLIILLGLAILNTAPLKLDIT